MRDKKLGITNLYYINTEVSANNLTTILSIKSYFIDILASLQILSKKISSAELFICVVYFHNLPSNF